MRVPRTVMSHRRTVAPSQLVRRWYALDSREGRSVSSFAPRNRRTLERRLDQVWSEATRVSMADTLTLVPERSRDGQVAVAAVFVVLDARRPRASTRHLLRGTERAVIGRGP